jgi:hypothetical protein
LQVAQVHLQLRFLVQPMRGVIGSRHQHLPWAKLS